ncbi:hypothetical protein H8S37_04135 [Mediterraneibacter sp. NSJ-55]|uniref:DUF7448 domain-containing protein n=1 Tax=Mediterraneibacter hominis TaxID=2763054 RepID=A0A923LHA2_9FIRM|nr:hypothetical protein [Mediterraneibacter hominis]MBC5688122.1 hypothetical protein [Mediterraneibacter hominis]
MLGKILKIEEVTNVCLTNTGTLNGSGGRLGIMEMPSALCTYEEYDGYRITTDKHEFNILISNGQNCCEHWGYFYSNDNEQDFVGADLLEVNLTDKELNKEVVNKSGYYDDCGGIQFVDFVTTKGILQIAVYNAHNGYYGHPIIFAKDKEIFCSDTL